MWVEWRDRLMDMRCGIIVTMMMHDTEVNNIMV
jgi:hypothetical protein